MKNIGDVFQLSQGSLLLYGRLAAHFCGDFPIIAVKYGCPLYFTGQKCHFKTIKTN